MAPPPLPSKKEVLLGLLEKTSVLVHLDARGEDVKVPQHLKTNPQLILQLGLNLAVPIPDLDVGDAGVSCTLSFSRVKFFCVLPFPAIFAMVSEDGGRAMVWPEDVPAEVARAAEAEARKMGLVKSPGEEGQSAEPPPKIEIGHAPPPKRPRETENKLRSAKTKPTVVAEKPREPAAVRTKRELPPYLRVIK